MDGETGAAPLPKSRHPISTDKTDADPVINSDFFMNRAGQKTRPSPSGGAVLP